MAKANPIKWISAKAKELRRKRPGAKWSALIKEASREYKSGHKTVKRAVKRVKRAVKRVAKRRRSVSRVSGTRPPGAHIVKHKKSKGSQPIAWYIVKMHSLGFTKSGRSYITIGGKRRIVWQTWDEKEAKKYLKAHCIKSK
jgi:hypothetical protein